MDVSTEVENKGIYHLRIEDGARSQNFRLILH